MGLQPVVPTAQAAEIRAVGRTAIAVRDDAPLNRLRLALRHGEVFNPEKVLYGRLPGYRLSETGEAMARAAADWFAERRPVTHLVSSPLERAQQTAESLLAELAEIEQSLSEQEKIRRAEQSAERGV